MENVLKWIWWVVLFQCFLYKRYIVFSAISLISTVFITLNQNNYLIISIISILYAVSHAYPFIPKGNGCTNTRIYVSNLPPGVEAADIVTLFAGLGTVARERPKGMVWSYTPGFFFLLLYFFLLDARSPCFPLYRGRGVFKDQMPHRLKLYGKDDCLLFFEEASTAHSAPNFYNGAEFKGSKIKVELAQAIPGQVVSTASPT